MRTELTQEEKDILAEFNKNHNHYVSEEALLEVINFVDVMEISDEVRAAIFNGINEQ